MTTQEQQRAKAYDAKQPLDQCTYEFVPADGATGPSTQELNLDLEVAKLFGISDTKPEAVVRAVSKTWAFTGKISTAAGEPVATLENLTITATKVDDPHTGRPFIHIALDYFATSHGWRTGRGVSGEPYGMSNRIYFKNSGGGIVWATDLPVFVLGCGWHREHQTYFGIDRYNVGWFDVCQGVQHEVRGVIFRC
ncbi:hypothetical protein ACIP39_29530 [Streptomyces tibetensis]|uniref:hypothetical protein n=1 Tax=Streptomyces tibetensis TaxID=2382123 RepID=UPI0037F5ABC8